MPEKKKDLPEIDTSITEEDKVRFKPFLGIRPGVYLAVLYGLAILVILFFITLYPGLTNPGTVLTVKSEPMGAAVRVDGAYMNAAPCEIFVSRGRHRIEIVLPGFTDHTEEIEAGGAVFCSLFFPRREYLNVELKTANPVDAFIEAAAEFAAWSFYGEATAVNQIPLVLSENAYRLGKNADDPLVMEGMKETLKGAARFTVTRSGLRDLLRTKFLLDNQGQSASPFSILGSSAEILDYLEGSPGAAFWLARVLTDESAAQIMDSSWFENTDLAGNFVDPGSAYAGRQIETYGGLKFREIIAAGPSAVDPVNAKTFYIAETPVPKDLWDLFLDEVPQWRNENKQSLIDRGLVNSQYLSYSYFPGLPENTAAWISWYAAAAWCEWYNTKLTQNVPGIIRLPGEAEWETAAGTGLGNIGDFWEWCGDPYAPMNYLPAPESAFDPGSPERPVRGGAWINPRYTVNLDTRGSLPPDSCSPFVSFRPVISAEIPEYPAEIRIFP